MRRHPMHELQPREKSSAEAEIERGEREVDVAAAEQLRPGPVERRAPHIVREIFPIRLDHRTPHTHPGADRHRLLAAGFDVPAWRLLVATNWLRTAAWSARGALALAMIGRALG